jgi:alkaline phosphatase D
MAKKITRRQAVLGVSSTLLLPAACSQTPFAPDGRTGSVFEHGVASGDPDTTSVIIWTRVSGSKAPVPVDWYVATDAEMLDVVSHGQFTTNAERDYTVKQLVDGLAPGRRFFYQFVVNGTTSPLGQTKTLPVGHVDRLVLAVASCSNYPFGYFNAYEVIANDDEVDLVVHLGDYIYEYRARGGYGGATGRRIGRNHKPRHEAGSLKDYRIRHAQYKGDPESIAMHARHPLIAIWDDHESANNPWMEGAENHQLIDGNWFARRAASMQAFYEWMPIRDPGPGGSWERYWRHFKFGDLASLITLESRHTGRSEQITWGRRLNDFEGVADANAFYNEIVGAPDRNMLSAEMENFLKSELAESANSGRRWRIIGNQSVMASRRAPKLDEPFFEDLRKDLGGSARRLLDDMTRLGELDLPWDLDAWDGYPAARERFYQLAKDAGVEDLLVISGDSHSSWANALYDADAKSMGVELGATGITSPRSLLSFGIEGITRWDELAAANNREIVWVDGRHRGFTRLDITHDAVRADFVTVSDVESRDYEIRIVKSMDIEHKNGTLRYVR